MKKNIKRIAITSLIILYFLISKSFANVGTVIVPAVRLREKPSTESDIITNIYEDDKVNILEDNGEWYKIEYNGNKGYVKKEFLNISENSKTNTSVKENTESSIEKNNYQENNQNEVVGNNQNVEKNENSTQSSIISLRILPNITSKVIIKLDKNKIINQISEINDWVKVTDGTTTGWVLKVKLSQEITNQENNTNETTKNSIQEGKTEEQEEPKQEEVYINKTGKINVETAIVRETANSNAEIKDFLDYNDEVTIIAEDGEWYKIVKDNINGYVNKRLITLTVSSRSLIQQRENDDTEVNEEINNLVNDVLSNTQESSNTNTGVELVEFAKKYLGYPYVLGGKIPETGFDCSGFTKYVYSNFGYTLGNTAASQNNLGLEVTRENLQLGDLILFYDEAKTKIGHTGIYIGDGNFIHAANPDRGVVTDNLDTNSYYNTRIVMIKRIIE